MSPPVSLIGASWRAGRFEAWSFDDEGEVLGTFARDGAADQGGVLQDMTRALITEWLGSSEKAPVIVCGETPGGAGKLLQVPALLSDLYDALTDLDGIHVVPGLRQLSPPDILQGQEVQLLGLGQLSGAICLPGRHTKHVALEQGRVLDFSTEMTGEIQELLLSQGSLRVPAGIEPRFDAGIFRDWVERSLDTDDAASPFAVSAARLIGVLRPEHQITALSGLLIGADVAAHYDPGDDVILVADGELAKAYGMALDALGASVEEYSAEEAMQDGLFDIAEEAGLLDT
ncbi:2-dehydro-3-deoxygalactonokinase [Hyphomonas oceanitis]|uniref:Putative 2-dehydro-3-deoxygalactonokinase n=1 Tax=Hyphomonas oceanitis SCH89 TaxID=1280953 RepID=A0A059G5D5_9PROT|nr:2-dehydro-3-deoxygalactonokinase [Hyphomonas oceanitis]KDA02026.1 putative 2-dehydro-3-deoxygalactonokinase [Hyphomonas oceanitis SCH89]